MKAQKKKKTKKVKNIERSELNPNEKMFCQLYFRSGEFFGNGTWSYIRAFDFDIPLVARSYLTNKQKKQYDVARDGSSRLLAKACLIKEGDKILKSTFNAMAVDKELNKVITQDKDRVSKVMAIKEFNQLQNRIQKKIDLTSKGEKIQYVVQSIESYAEPKGKN